MKTYNVQLRTIDIYEFDKIQADTKEDAIQKAWGIYESEERYKYHHDSLCDENAEQKINKDNE